MSVKKGHVQTLSLVRTICAECHCLDRLVTSTASYTLDEDWGFINGRVTFTLILSTSLSTSRRYLSPGAFLRRRTLCPDSSSLSLSLRSIVPPPAGVLRPLGMSSTALEANLAD